MKISIFIDIYEKLLETKDPVQIVLGLNDLHVNADIICSKREELTDYKPNFAFEQYSYETFVNEKFWTKLDSDVILFYSWISESYTPILEKMKFAGKKVIVKADSDGRIGYPLGNVLLRIPLLEDFSARNVIRYIFWHLPFKKLHSERASQRIKHIELSDAVLIESPNALDNLKRFLVFWKRPDLTKKLFFMPNPVTPEFLEAPLSKKDNIVVSYGRWNDYKQKNTRIMVKALVEFLKARKDYRAIIFGRGAQIIRKMVGNLPTNITERITIYDFVERPKIIDYLANGKIFFVPSRWESFSISSGEALCMGCSVVGTPIESLQFLTRQGFSGTISSNFKMKPILNALLEDAQKWDSGLYNIQEIAQCWRKVLDRKVIAEDLVKLAKKIA